MFTYVTKTNYNYSRIYTYTFPVENTTDRLSFLKYYKINDENYYQKNYDNVKLNADTVSQYSVTFIDSNQNIIQTNQNFIINMYTEFSNWNPRTYNTVSVPPRSRIYLFKNANAQGKYYIFDNDNDNSVIHTIELTIDDDISSIKWVTKFPVKNMYVLDEHKSIYRPIYKDSGYDLAKQQTILNEPLYIPVYKFEVSPYKYTKINNLYNH